MLGEDGPITVQRVGDCRLWLCEKGWKLGEARGSPDAWAAPLDGFNVSFADTIDTDWHR